MADVLPGHACGRFSQWRDARHAALTVLGRSDRGRRCRDKFLSLITTCRKLGLSVWLYLKDRLRGAALIPPLPDLLRHAALARLVAFGTLADSDTRRREGDRSNAMPFRH